MNDLYIKVIVIKNGKITKNESFQDPIDLVAWVCRCYQASKRAARGKIISAKTESIFQLKGQ